MTDYSKDGNQRSGSIDHTDKPTLEYLYYGQRLSINDIADLADVDYNTVHYWMEKHGLDRRDKSEALKEEHSVGYANYFTTERGRTFWRSYNPNGSDDYVLVYRLLAVSEYGFDAVEGKHVHHKKSIPWLNTPENIELMNPSEHLSMHGETTP